MSTITKKYNLRLFEILYFFYMVLNMAFMTKETRIMMGGLSESPILFSIPIILTIIICFRNKVDFSNKSLYIMLGILTLWSLLEITLKEDFSFNSIKNYLNFYYALLVAYIHVKVFKDKIFLLYEDIMVFFSKFSLLFWILMVIMPNLGMTLARHLPKTGYGYNFLYLINIMDINLQQVEYGIVRNAGCSWEPGRFAIMLCLALLFHLYSYGFKIEKRKMCWLIVALLTTMSTTGYVLGGIILLYMGFRRLNFKAVFYIVLIIIPVIFFFFQLNFIGNKINKKIDINQSVEHIEESYEWTEGQTEKGEVAYSMDRFPSFYFEYINFKHDPIIGYGANWSNSFFYKNYTPSIGITGGLMTMLSRFGIFLGLYLLYILYLTSKKIALLFKSNKKYGLLLCFVISMISYPIIWFPLYTAIWFYGFFKK